MYNFISKTGLFSLRNLISYRIIGGTITEKIGEQLLDFNVLAPFIRSNINLHCLSCISYDILSTSILVYILTYNISGKLSSVKRFDKVEELSTLRKTVEKIVWIILFVITKNVENAI
jgi:hypothetical protein